MSEEKAKEPKSKSEAPKRMDVAEAAAAVDAIAGGAETPAPKKVKIKTNKHVPVGIVFIRATFNNTLVSITDMRGQVIAWSTAGRGGFKGSKKSTAYAATMAAQDAARQAMNFGLQEVEVRVQGPGSGRESAIRAVQAAGLNITSIRDITPMPHNGCRPRKRRRV